MNVELLNIFEIWMDDRNAIFREEIIMQIIKSKKEKVKGYACAPSVLAGAAAMGVMVVAVFVGLWYNGFLTDALILVTIGPIEVGGVWRILVYQYGRAYLSIPGPSGLHASIPQKCCFVL